MTISVPTEKPSWREIARSVPFAVRVAYDADPRSFIIIALMTVLFAPLQAGTVVSVKEFADAVSVRHQTSSVLWLLALAGSFLATGWADQIRMNRLMHLRFNMEYALERRAQLHAMRVSYATLEDPQYQLLSSLYQRRWHALAEFMETMSDIVGAVFTYIGLSFMMVYIPWYSLAIMLIAFTLRVLASQFLAQLQWQLASFETREGRRAQYYRLVVTNPIWLIDAKSNGTDRTFFDRWDAITSKLLRERIKDASKNLLVLFTVRAIDVIGLGVTLAVVGHQALTGTSAVTLLTVLLASYPRIIGAMQQISGGIDRLMRQGAFLPVVKGFLEVPVEQDDGEVIPLEKVTIEFRDVWFRYESGAKDVLCGVSFTIHPGEQIALVGLNGAGKSTIIKLLMGVYRPTSGTILVNGVPLNSIRPSVWRDAVTVQWQDSGRYSDPIEDQVAIVNRDETKESERWKMALETSNLAEISTEFPKGLKTFVGRSFAMPEDEAIDLSGGQTQILATARTLFRDARVFVFDEPTSHVDAQKEERFFARLSQALPEATTVFVSHRFSTLRRAKRVLVLNEGILEEQGTHDELLARGGIYAKLFHLQARAYQ